eukprot:1214988-Rhodomonas_salina.2
MALQVLDSTAGFVERERRQAQLDSLQTISEPTPCASETRRRRCQPKSLSGARCEHVVLNSRAMPGSHLTWPIALRVTDQPRRPRNKRIKSGLRTHPPRPRPASHRRRRAGGRQRRDDRGGRGRGERLGGRDHVGHHGPLAFDLGGTMLGQHEVPTEGAEHEQGGGVGEEVARGGREVDEGR